MAQFHGKERSPVPSIPWGDPRGKQPARELAFDHHDVEWDSFGTYGPGSDCSREELSDVFHWHLCPLSRVNALRSLLVEPPRAERNVLLSRALEDPDWDIVYIALDWIRMREAGAKCWGPPALGAMTRALAEEFKPEAQSRIMLLALDVMRVSGEPLAEPIGRLLMDSRPHIRNAAFHALKSVKGEIPQVLDQIRACMQTSEEYSPCFSHGLEALRRACQSGTAEFRHSAYVCLGREPRAAKHLVEELAEALKERRPETYALVRAALKSAGKDAIPALEQHLACWALLNDTLLASAWHPSQPAIGAPLRALQRRYRVRIREAIREIEGTSSFARRAFREVKAFAKGIARDIRERLHSITVRI